MGETPTNVRGLGHCVVVVVAQHSTAQILSACSIKAEKQTPTFFLSPVRAEGVKKSDFSTDLGAIREPWIKLKLNIRQIVL